MKSTYEKFPQIVADGEKYCGWSSIIREISSKIETDRNRPFVVAIESYQGVHHDELTKAFKQIPHSLFIDTSDVFMLESEIRSITYPDVTDDAIFGYMTRLTMSDLLDSNKVKQYQEKILQITGTVVVYGNGASLVATNADILIYADMARWEIQLRMKKHQISNLGIYNNDDTYQEQYKRGFFVDWRICDKLKKSIFDKIDFWLDTNKANEPKMIGAKTFSRCLDNAVSQPFRVVPYFDPGPWGGQWMKEKFALDETQSNFAWCFDCVPEENSLLFNFDGVVFEMPAINVVFFRTRELLGSPVEARFGQEFPIRFDFLDTIEGGNLSLQVHPNNQYIREEFGMAYTQDESYYMLDAKQEAKVYLGLKEGIDSEQMLEELRMAQEGNQPFDTDKFINSFPAHKHDHFLIPAGTVHCSGKNGLVLEISATPYIFTFKLWDWARLGLDGKPRPINVERGSHVIDWGRDTNYVRAQLINRVEQVAQGDGWREERTGLHENEFIETRRHWFTKAVPHTTGNSVNVLNLVEGDAVVVESPDNKFSPYIVHYAETFIIPASIGEYIIRPMNDNKECATIKAYVRL